MRQPFRRGYWGGDLQDDDQHQQPTKQIRLKLVLGCPLLLRDHGEGVELPPNGYSIDNAFGIKQLKGEPLTVITAAAIDYTALPLRAVHAGLQQVALDAPSTFGALTSQQLNWRPSATQWSVAQCLEHLIAANRMMFQSMDDALQGKGRTIWTRLPWIPRLMGRALIRSQAPEGTQKFKAGSRAQPAASDIGADVVARFVAQHHDAAARVNALDETVAAHTIMISPFIRVVSYSVLDGWRIVLAHDHRHLEQARRVLQTRDRTTRTASRC